MTTPWPRFLGVRCERPQEVLRVGQDAGRDVHPASDVREDREGSQLRLAVRVVDVDGCTPIPDAVFEIWHCDAEGLYSGFEAASKQANGLSGGGTSRTSKDETRYLRGAQVTDANGIAVITTIYPGWYTGRSVHMHAKVAISNETVLVTQLYFDDARTDQVHEVAAYTSKSGRRSSNADDGFHRPDLEVSVSDEGEGYLGPDHHRRAGLSKGMPSTLRRSIVTPKSVVEWSADGATVTKRAANDHVDEVLGRYRAAVRNEIRINRLLSDEAPPVAVPKLLAWSARNRSMTFEAIDGEPLGPKFPTTLPAADIDDLIALGQALDPYQPKRRWFRRLDVERRLRHHVRSGLLLAGDADAIRVLAHDHRVRWRFAHADLTARNVLRRTDGQLVLIDWEWAGLYPTGYELAFLWFSLSDVPGARAVVGDAIAGRNEAGFLISAILIQLLHLHLFRDGGSASPFLPRHQETLHDLLRRLPRR